MKKRLLFSGAGGSIFPYMFQILEKEYDVYAMDSDPKITLLYKNEKIFTVPDVLDDNFEIVISNIIEKNKIDFYIAGIDEELLIASKIAKKTSIKTLSPDEIFIEFCLDKFALMDILMKNNISTIPTLMGKNYKDNFEYPIFLKPNVGRGSRGIRKIDSLNQYEAYFILEEYSKEEVLIQPYIGGDEYTVSVTVNNLNQLLSVVPKIVYTKQGITKYAKCVHHKQIEDICRLIVDKLKPHGSFNVQLKLKDNKVFIFEINPRFSTTLVLTMASGVNEIDLAIKNYDKQEVCYIENFKETKLIRRWESYFYE
jgi:carbamoyl-phosphate synthase large subunit